MKKITKKTSGGGYRLYKILNKDIKELNGIILSLLCISFLILVGIISYKVNSSYAIFTDTIEGEKTLEFSVGFPQDRSGANAPVLSENMIPVYYDDTSDVWRKADSSNMNSQYKWYDYDNKMWANSVTVSATSSETTLILDDGGVKNCSGTTCARTDYVNAELGTAIPMKDILTMQVWIPRYKYTIWNYNSAGAASSEPHEINIEFERASTTTGEIKCTDLANMGTSNGTASGTQQATSETCIIKSNNTTCTNDSCNGKTYTHPAFTFGDEELTGFWVGKFEVSSDINCIPTDASTIGAGCNIDTIRPLVKPNEISWYGAMVSIYENNMMAMNDTNNKYGFVNADDTHMMKNSEWGAVAYLSHSKYGTCTDGECREIGLNSANTNTTGCGPQSEASTTSSSVCTVYNTSLGQSASTTGNIYGIYDISGGSYEYVMGNTVSPDGETMMSGQRDTTSYPNYHSGYSGILYYNGTTAAGYGTYKGTYEYPNDKYYDKYSFNTSNTSRGRSKLGDALKEVYNTSSYGWYSDIFGLAYSYYPWFCRGGNYSIGSDAGVFYSSIYSNGLAYTSMSARLVISQ